MLKTRHREKILFEAAIASKTKIVIDNNNISKVDRARYIQLAKTAGFEVISYYFETDLDSTLQRNAQREGKANIAEKGVKATFYKLEAPNRSEGFDVLLKVNMIENNGFSITLITE